MDVINPLLVQCPVSFHLCASKGRLDCLEVIISHGADLKTTDGAGKAQSFTRV